jgi:hypothetical protein
VPDILLRPLVTLIEGEKRRSALGRKRTATMPSVMGD